MTTPPPMERLTELHLGSEIKRMIGETYVPNDRPVVLGYVDEQGLPHLSFYGSVFVYSPTQLAMWVRNAKGGMATAIATNPNVMLIYREPEGPNGVSRAVLRFYGRASLVRDESLRRSIYDQILQIERDRDKDYQGTGVVIDLDRVQGFMPGFRLDMTRA